MPNRGTESVPDLGGEDGLQAGRAAVLDENVFTCDAGLLDGFRMRGKIQARPVGCRW